MLEVLGLSVDADVALSVTVTVWSVLPPARPHCTGRLGMGLDGDVSVKTFLKRKFGFRAMRLWCCWQQ